MRRQVEKNAACLAWYFFTSDVCVCFQCCYFLILKLGVSEVSGGFCAFALAAWLGSPRNAPAGFLHA